MNVHYLVYKVTINVSIDLWFSSAICTNPFAGGTPLTDQQLSLCIKQAFKRSTEVLRLIDDTLSSVER